MKELDPKLSFEERRLRRLELELREHPAIFHIAWSPESDRLAISGYPDSVTVLKLNKPTPSTFNLEKLSEFSAGRLATDTIAWNPYKPNELFTSSGSVTKSWIGEKGFEVSKEIKDLPASKIHVTPKGEIFVMSNLGVWYTPENIEDLKAVSDFSGDWSTQASPYCIAVDHHARRVYFAYGRASELVTYIDLGDLDASYSSNDPSEVKQIIREVRPNYRSDAIIPDQYNVRTITSIVMSHTNQVLYVGHINGLIMAYDVSKGGFKLKDRTNHDPTKIVYDPANSLTLSDDGKLLVSTNGKDVTLWNADSLEQGEMDKFSVGEKESLFPVTISPSGEFLATGLHKSDGTYILIAWIQNMRPEVTMDEWTERSQQAAIYKVEPKVYNLR